MSAMVYSVRVDALELRIDKPNWVVRKASINWKPVNVIRQRSNISIVGVTWRETEEPRNVVLCIVSEGIEINEFPVNLFQDKLAGKVIPRLKYIGTTTIQKDDDAYTYDSWSVFELTENWASEIGAFTIPRASK